MDISHQFRVVDERNDLAGRITRLLAFVKGPVFPTLPLAERIRLVKQLGFMDSYHSILVERIEAFPVVR